MGPQEPEENISHMDASLYKAAAEGNIEVFNNKQGLQLESLKTPNHDNVLHVNLATQETAAWLLNRFHSCDPVMSFFITMIKREKRSDFIEQILRKCPSLLLQTNAKGQTPLHVAARNGHSAIVKLLIKFCAKARDGDLEKLGMDQVNAVREMLRITDQESNMALHEAARCGNVEVAKALLEFEDPEFPYSANKKQETPLYITARRRGSGRLLTLLLDKFKSTAHGGPHGRTALHAAAMAGDADGDLEKLGMDQVNAVRWMLRITDQESNTALHEAARCGNVEVVKALLEFEDPDFPYSANKKQETPLYIAARRGDGGMLSILLDKLKSAALGGPHGRTVLHAAAMARDAEAIRIILEKKGNLTKERDEDGHTPLHYAAHLGSRFSVVEELLKWDISAAYIGDKKRGMTPLLMAARQGYLGTCSKILSLCPDCCEKVDNYGLNLLHYAAFRDSVFRFGSSVFKRGGAEIVYGSVRNLMELEGAFGVTPQEVYNTLRSMKQHHKQKQIKELLEELENDQVAEEPVCKFRLPNVSTKRLAAIRNTHLIVAALIATVTFAAAITVPGGLESEKGSKQGTPFLIHEAAFKVFVVTNALAFIYSVSALCIYFRFSLFSHLRILKEFYLFVIFWRYYVVLKPSHGLVIVSYLICPAFFFILHWTIFDYYIKRILFYR
ncbi:hypothetical protein V6Z11_D04G219300 [Gossypium hirsutum]